MENFMVCGKLKCKSDIYEQGSIEVLANVEPLNMTTEEHRALYSWMLENDDSLRTPQGMERLIRIFSGLRDGTLKKGNWDYVNLMIDYKNSVNNWEQQQKIIEDCFGYGYDWRKIWKSFDKEFQKGDIVDWNEHQSAITRIMNKHKYKKPIQEEIDNVMDKLESNFHWRNEYQWEKYKAMAEEAFGKDDFDWKKVWKDADADNEIPNVRDLMKKYLPRYAVTKKQS